MAKVPDYRDMKGCTYTGEYFHPCKMDEEGWDKKEKEILECVELGMPPHRAFKVGGLTTWLYYDWSRRMVVELEKGVKDSPFVLFMLSILKKSEVFHKRLLQKGNEIALEGEGNAKMIQYLLDNRYKYSKKKEVEISTADDTTFNINIIDSKPKEDD